MKTKFMEHVKEAGVGRKPNARGATGFVPQFLGVRLPSVMLDHADLTNALADRADFSFARFVGAKLVRTSLKGAKLTSANMTGADMTGADMTGADLQGTILLGANLAEANLRSANLRNAMIFGVNFRQAHFAEDTDTRGAGVMETDLSNLDIDAKHLDGMFGDGSVTLPGGVTPDHPDWPAHWPTEVLDDEAFQTQWRAFQRTIGYTPLDER